MVFFVDNLQNFQTNLSINVVDARDKALLSGLLPVLYVFGGLCLMLV